MRRRQINGVHFMSVSNRIAWYAAALAVVAVGGCKQADPITPSAQSQYVLLEDLEEDAEGIHGEQKWSDEIMVGPDLSLRAEITVTAKGNGFLTVGGAQLGRVYDGHADGATFEGRLANIVFRDINGDGFKDIVVSGIINLTDEKGTKVLERRPFVRIILFDPDQRTFNVAYDSTVGSPGT